MTDPIFEGLDNQGRPKRLYLDHLRTLKDPDLKAESATKIWSSAFADSNPNSDYHWQCDACIYEGERRGKPQLYDEAWRDVAVAVEGRVKSSSPSQYHTGDRYFLSRMKPETKDSLSFIVATGPKGFYLAAADARTLCQFESLETWPNEAAARLALKTGAFTGLLIPSSDFSLASSGNIPAKQGRSR